MKQGFIAIVMVAMLASCAGYNRDCNRDVGAAEIAVTEAYKTLTELYMTGIIDKDKAKKAFKVVVAARAAVDRADELCKLQDPKVTDYLVQAAQALAQFSTLTGGK